MNIELTTEQVEVLVRFLALAHHDPELYTKETEGLRHVEILLRDALHAEARNTIIFPDA